MGSHVFNIESKQLKVTFLTKENPNGELNQIPTFKVFKPH